MQPPNDHIPRLVEGTIAEFGRYLDDHYPNRQWESRRYQVLPDGNSISIAQVREMKYFLRLKSNKHRLVVFYEFDRATIEAQNSILKTLEEKNTDNYFILHIKTRQTVLPTIISRSKFIKLRSNSQTPLESSLLTDALRLYKNDLPSLLQSPDLKAKTVVEARLILENVLIGYNKELSSLKKNDLQVVKLVYKLLSALDRNVNPQLALDWLALRLQTL